MQVALSLIKSRISRKRAYKSSGASKHKICGIYPVGVKKGFQMVPHVSLSIYHFSLKPFSPFSNLKVVVERASLIFGGSKKPNSWDFGLMFDT